MLVSSVSRHWREVAVATPELWKDINHISPAAPRDLVEEYLRRSGSLPLTLHLNVSERDQGSLATQLTANELMKHFVQYSSRWRGLSIEGDCEDIPNVLQVLKNIHVPLLEEFRLYFSDIHHAGRPCHEIDDLPPHILTDAPLLTSVHSDGISILKCRPPLGQIQTLVLKDAWYGFDAPQYFELLRNLPSVEHLVLFTLGEWYMFEGVDWDAFARIEMPCLRSLTFCDTKVPLSLAMRGMNAPILELLIVWYYGSMLLKDPATNFPSIRSMTFIQWTHTINTEFWDCSFPKLEHLTLAQCDHDKIFRSLRSLTPSKMRNDMQIPRLAHLRTLSIAGPQAGRTNELVSFVDWRIKAKAPLEKVYINHNIDVDWKLLRKLVEVADFSPNQYLMENPFGIS